MDETRQDILNEYQVEDGRIVSPGKFEGEPIYAPYFWASLMNGLYDEMSEDDDNLVYFDVTEADRVEFQELANIKRIALWSDDNGFVYTRAYYGPELES